MNKYYSNKLAICIFAIPTLLLFTLFVVYPIFPEIKISFQSNNGFKSLGYVGWDNYLAVLKSGAFWKSNGNTLIIVLISTCIALPVSMLLALVMDRQSDGVRRFFKNSSVFPAVLSVTVIGQMWVAIYEPQWGLINSILRAVGLDNFALVWLSDKRTVLIAITVAYLWQYIGLNTLLFYTGITSIPKTYYEAATIDGSGFLKTSIKITIPLLQDVTKYVLTLSVLGSMSQFAHVRVMTAGGPGDISRTVIYQLYYKAFSTSDYGQGCAIAIIFVIECLILSFLINRFVAREKIEY